MTAVLRMKGGKQPQAIDWTERIGIWLLIAVIITAFRGRRVFSSYSSVYAITWWSGSVAAGLVPALYPMQSCWKPGRETQKRESPRVLSTISFASKKGLWRISRCQKRFYEYNWCLQEGQHSPKSNYPPDDQLEALPVLRRSLLRRSLSL